MQALTIQLQESSPTLNKMSEVKLKRDKRSLIVSVMLFPARRYRGCLSSLTLRANRRNLVDHWTPNIVGCYMLRPFAHPVACCWILLRVVAQSLKPVKLFAPFKRTQPLLAYNSQHCWMLHVASVCTSCCMLLDVVACCCAKFETDQTFRPEQTDATLLAYNSEHCWELLRPFARSLRLLFISVNLTTWPPRLDKALPTLLVLSTRQGIHAGGEFFRWIFKEKNLSFIPGFKLSTPALNEHKKG